MHLMPMNDASRKGRKGRKGRHFFFTATCQNHSISGRFFTTDFTDFTDGNPDSLIREIREIRGCISLVAALPRHGLCVRHRWLAHGLLVEAEVFLASVAAPDVAVSFGAIPSAWQLQNREMAELRDAPIFFLKRLFALLPRQGAFILTIQHRRRAGVGRASCRPVSPASNRALLASVLNSCLSSRPMRLRFLRPGRRGVCLWPFPDALQAIG